MRQSALVRLFVVVDSLCCLLSSYTDPRCLNQNERTKRGQASRKFNLLVEPDLTSMRVLALCGVAQQCN